MTVTGPDFVALQVRGLEQAAKFYETVVGLTRAAFSPPHAVVFNTSPIPFAVRDVDPILAYLERVRRLAATGQAWWAHVLASPGY